MCVCVNTVDAVVGCKKKTYNSQNVEHIAIFWVISPIGPYSLVLRQIFPQKNKWHNSTNINKLVFSNVLMFLTCSIPILVMFFADFLGNLHIPPLLPRHAKPTTSPLKLCAICWCYWLIHQLMWGLPKIWVSQNGWSILENPIKMDDLGYLGVPPFLETSMWVKQYHLAPSPSHHHKYVQRYV